MKGVPERLNELGDLYRQRNKLYGDNYKHFGAQLAALFPDGVVLKGAEEFNRFALLLQIIHKVSRYARAMDAGHVDSLDDIAVYAQMLQEYDEECKYPADIITHVDFGPAEDLMQASDNVTELRGG